jgi:hypothetical protein
MASGEPGSGFLSFSTKEIMQTRSFGSSQSLTLQPFAALKVVIEGEPQSLFQFGCDER